MDLIDIALSLFTLTILEIVLGIDNIIFVSIVADKLPKEQQQKARRIGLTLALLVRIVMLFGISLLVKSTDSIFELFDKAFSIRDLILLGGGMFLLYKTTTEIHHKINHESQDVHVGKVTSYSSAISQIIMLDIVFSFDSILTAVGMTTQLGIMIAAVVISMIVMLIFASRIAKFINENPTVQMLALSFLILISVILIADGFGQHIEKGYIYFALGFSLLVEMLNLRKKKKTNSEVK